MKKEVLTVTLLIAVLAYYSDRKSEWAMHGLEEAMEGIHQRIETSVAQTEGLALGWQREF